MISVGILMIVGMVIWMVIESVRTSERGNQHRIIRRLFGGLTNPGMTTIHCYAELGIKRIMQSNGLCGVSSLYNLFS